MGWTCLQLFHFQAALGRGVHEGSFWLWNLSRGCGFLSQEWEIKLRAEVNGDGGVCGQCFTWRWNRQGKLGEFSALDHPSTLTDVIFTEIKFSFFLAFMPVTLPLVSNCDRCQCASSKASIFHSQGLEGGNRSFGALLYLQHKQSERHLFYGRKPGNWALKESPWESKAVGYPFLAAFQEIVHVKDSFLMQGEITQQWEQGLGLVCSASEIWNCTGKGLEPYVLCFRPRIWFFFLCRWCICK